jgi:hypothetical protein
MDKRKKGGRERGKGGRKEGRKGGRKEKTAMIMIPTLEVVLTHSGSKKE